MSWYPKKECTKEDIEWFMSNTVSVADPGEENDRVLSLDGLPPDVEPRYRVHFSEDGFGIQFGFEEPVWVPWKQTWAFANIFYAAKRVVEFQAKARRLQATTKTPEKRPQLYVVDDSPPEDRREERRARAKALAEKSKARRAKATARARKD